jgi:hypothetical protein
VASTLKYLEPFQIFASGVADANWRLRRALSSMGAGAKSKGFAARWTRLKPGAANHRTPDRRP